MLKKLKRKFILLATISMLVLMSLLCLVMNSINYSLVVKDVDNINDMLFHMDHRNDVAPPQNNDKQNLSPEIPYEARFFIVTVNQDGTIDNIDLSRILTIDENKAKEYTSKVINKNNEKGFIKYFRFEKRSFGNEKKIIFLDCERKLDSFKSFLWISVSVSFTSIIIMFFVFVFVSGKIVKPMSESYDKQKRFIIDASHEMKTPLTIINANTDLIEDSYNGEELNEIRLQTKKLTKLTNDLVYLSKMEDTKYKSQKIDIPLSEMVYETILSFKTLANTKHIDIIYKIDPNITICANPNEINQLVSILLDNSIKYSIPKDNIVLNLSKGKKHVTLSISNKVDKKINKNDLSHVFDRFYRLDESRNSEVGGHGIGLSIAKAIVDSHFGEIKAISKFGNDFCIIITLPIGKLN